MRGGPAVSLCAGQKGLEGQTRWPPRCLGLDRSTFSEDISSGVDAASGERRCPRGGPVFPTLSSGASSPEWDQRRWGVSSTEVSRCYRAGLPPWRAGGPGQCSTLLQGLLWGRRVRAPQPQAWASVTEDSLRESRLLQSAQAEGHPSAPPAAVRGPVLPEQVQEDNLQVDPACTPRHRRPAETWTQRREPPLCGPAFSL